MTGDRTIRIARSHLAITIAIAIVRYFTRSLERSLWVTSCTSHFDYSFTIPNDKGRTLFHCACFRLRSDIITHLIDYPEIDLKAIDYTGECLLHHMIQGLIRSINS